MSLACLSLLIFYLGVLIYIAKKGGIPNSTSTILFITKDIRHYLQFLILTLSQLGSIISFGRYSFPFFFLLTALEFSYSPLAVKLSHKKYLFSIIPIISLILYYPSIFERLSSSFRFLVFIVSFTRVWTILYILFTFIIIIYEYKSIIHSFFKRRFIFKSLMLISLGMLYLLYLPQDPAQVYLFYRNEFMWKLGLWYLTPVMNDGLYALITIVSLILASISIATLSRYISLKITENREELELQAKGKAAETGSLVFLHGTKNDLLAMKILMKKINSRYQDDDLDKLNNIINNLSSRINDLHKDAATRSSHLVPAALSDIIDDALYRVNVRRNSARVNVSKKSIKILADKNKLSEAIANIIINALDANEAAKRDDAIDVVVVVERLWVLIYVKDRGNGIDSKLKKHIFEPFVSSKSSASNWGMGLYHARTVIKNHLGQLKFSDRVGGGTEFVISLPILENGEEND